MQNIKCPDCGNLNPDIRDLGYTLPATCGHCLHMWRLQDVDPHSGCIVPPTPAAPAQQPELWPYAGSIPPGADDIVRTIALALERGYSASEILDENSPIRDRINATPAPAPADHATVERWEAALTAVMPADLKCWHENSRREWPEVAVWVIEGLRQSRDEAWATVERLTATAPAPAAPTLPAHQRTAPARIYLHDGDDEHTEPFPAGMDDGVTWSSDNATGLGVPYVRADLIRSSVAAQEKKGGA